MLTEEKKRMADEARVRFESRFPGLNILLWEPGPSMIFVEYQGEFTKKVGRAHLGYDGSLIQRL